MLMPMRLALILMVVTFSRGALAARYVAFSLRQAQSVLAQGKGVGPDVRDLAGITRLVGVVVDSDTADVILVGVVEKGAGPLTLDEFVIALRARMVHGEWPLVSLDNTPETKAQGLQRVRFAGKIEDTVFGKQLLDADVVLKKLALGKQVARVWGVRSYAELCEEAASRGDDSQASTLFWFFPMKTRLLVQPGVFAVASCSVGTRSQLLGGAAIATTQPTQKDPMGDKFASDMTAAYDDLCLQFPQLARVKQLFSAVAVADGLRDAKDVPDLSLLLEKYHVAEMQTPRTMKSLSAEGQLMKISGGIELRALLLRLQDEDVTALREAVLRSRPDKNTLTWPLPLSGWQVADGAVAPTSAEADPSDQFKQLGVSINREAIRPALFSPPRFAAAQAIVPVPTVVFDQRALTSPGPAQMPRVSPRIGGVMLSASASVKGASGEVNLSSGGFALVVDGRNAHLSSAAFDRFVTALWAVYYCSKSPGISIDPIDPSIDKHLVRYIGQVINSDLGRVMREADYHMKKVVIGVEKPRIRDFQTPDAWMAEHRELYLAYRRFWFVPEDLRFREGDGLLLFDSGRMRLRTELMVNGKRGQTTPADDAFAAFYTEHYDDFAQQYPIYGELFEYAKMVALAKYLKANGVPLHWFLLANRDRILTEDSPGTVVELALKSPHIEGLELRGGVDLGAQGRYVWDATAREALATALANVQSSGQSGDAAAPSAQVQTPRVPPATQPVAYTPIPQKSLTSGHDARGLRYQTDLAFRMNGEPALELVRYFDWRKSSHGMFGNGWDMLLPYRVVLSRQIRQISVGDHVMFGPATVTILDALSAEQETLDFDPAKYKNLGYVPPAGSKSKTVGLFVTNAGALGAADEVSVPAYRLADKLGNEFSFDQRGLMTGMMLGPEHQITYTYARKSTRTIVRPSVKLRPVAGSGAVEVAGFVLPRRMTLMDMDGKTGLVLAAGADGRYRPEAGHETHVLGALASRDGRFTMADDEGNEVVFAQQGAVESISFSERTNVVQSMRYERMEEVKPGLMVAKLGQQIDFEFFVDLTGSVRVGRAKFVCHSPKSAGLLRYEYDASGYLARVIREELN